MDKILKMQSSNLPSITFVDGYNINLIISDMRKLVSLMFTFVLFLGTNAGKLHCRMKLILPTVKKAGRQLIIVPRRVRHGHISLDGRISKVHTMEA